MRDEEENVEGCLLALREALQNSGEAWEVIVVDDASSDSTYEKAKGFDFAKVIRIGEEERGEGVVGKNLALVRGYEASRGEILLFLDADVRLSPYSLRRVLLRFKGVDMLSVSPEQVYGSPWEASLQPMIFKLLGKLYPLEEVNDPNSPVAAANGQFILIRREVYEDVGTHRAVMGEVLEDVRLAERVKRMGYRLLFLHGRRYGIRARMYRDLDSMIRGWSKNLVPLLKGNVRLGLWYGLFNLFESLAGWVLTLSFALQGSYNWAMTVFFIFSVYFAYRFWTHMRVYTLIHATVGSALFLYVLWNSWRWYRRGEVEWKGRTYRVG